MEKNKDNSFFWIGTLFLVAALLVLTFLPKIIFDFIPFFYIEINKFRSIGLALFLIVLAFYFMSKNTYKRQLLAAALGFLYYFVFINFFAD